VTSVGEKEEKANTIQPLFLVFFSPSNFSQQKLITKNRNSSNLCKHNNINNSPQITKNHNSPLITHFLQNSLIQQQFNHNFTNSNTQDIIYHQQHYITSIKT